MPNVRRSRSRSEAVGLNTYRSPIVAVVGGLPEMTGARLPLDWAAAVIEKHNARGTSRR